MSAGWVKIHRKILENPIFLDAGLLQLFLYCILKSNHSKNTFIFNGELITIARGSFITGRKEIASDLGINESTVYKRLMKLKKLGYISVNSNNKFSLITVEKYELYQGFDEGGNNKVTTKEQQSNTNKNDKNDKEDSEGLTFAQRYFLSLANNHNEGKLKVIKGAGDGLR